MNWAITERDPQVLNTTVSPGRIHLALVIQPPHRLYLRRDLWFEQVTDLITDITIARTQRQLELSRG